MKTLLFFLSFCPALLAAQILLPGDANNDGRVDHLDVLAIGLNFGQEGPPRAFPDQNINWSPKPFQFWPFALPSTNINAGFSDCDGNGFINEADGKALSFNYDSMQQASIPPPMPYAPPDTFITTAIPRLVFRFDKDTATVKDTLLLHIFYEHPIGMPLEDSPMGLAFTIKFNEMLVKDSLTRVFFEPSANDLLFAAGATAFADSRAVPPGEVEFGAAGKAQPGLAFTRPLGVVRFIVEDVIVRADTFFTELKIDVSSALMLNLLEQVIKFNVVVDAIVLFQELSSSRPPPAPLEVRVYPSPVHDKLQIDSPDATLTGLQVYDALGQLVSSREFSSCVEMELFTGDWPRGWYWVQLMAADGRIAVRKVLKR